MTRPRSPAPPVTIEIEKRQGIWRWLLMAVALLLVAETLLANRGWRGAAARLTVVWTRTERPMTPDLQLLAALHQLRRQWRQRQLLEALAAVVLGVIGRGGRGVAALPAARPRRVHRARGALDGVAPDRSARSGASLVYPFLRRTSDERFALYVEERAPELRQALVSAVHELERPAGRARLGRAHGASRGAGARHAGPDLARAAPREASHAARACRRSARRAWSWRRCSSSAPPACATWRGCCSCPGPRPRPRRVVRAVCAWSRATRPCRAAARSTCAPRS